jgi:hypothetical protein
MSRTAGPSGIPTLAGSPWTATSSGDSDTNLKIVIYTTVPGSEDEGKPDLARVAGTRSVR